ncbi:MAG TPA: FAD-dependent oxidoreductase [Pseudolabrys sp.]|nr:FAD-dependent oxidoreductase [Pseudolabrys sp.]
MSEPLVIIGNGMAAAKLVEELNARALGRYAICVIGDEPRLAYNRVLLSSVLAREVSHGDIELKSADWWRAHGVTLLYGHRAVAIDADIRRVKLANGASLPFGKLVLATGSKAIRLNVPGMDMPGVVTFRDLGDVASMERAAKTHEKAVVIGGGLLGLEAAYGLAKAGMKVSVIHLMDRLMERQLDARASAMLKAAVEAKGISVYLNAETAAIKGERRAGKVMLKDGRAIDGDLVVVAAGIRANSDLAVTAGLDINRGIVVNDRLQASKADIYALGECAEHRGVCYGLVEPAYEQARVLAAHLAGGKAAYVGSVLATNLKVSGVSVFSTGDFMGAPGTETIVLTDPGLGSYKKLVLKDGRLVGAVLFGDTADGLWYAELIRGAAPVGAMRGDLIFGRALAERSMTKPEQMKSAPTYLAA